MNYLIGLFFALFVLYAAVGMGAAFLTVSAFMAAIFAFAFFIDPKLEAQFDGYRRFHLRMQRLYPMIFGCYGFPVLLAWASGYKSGLAAIPPLVLVPMFIIGMRLHYRAERTEPWHLPFFWRLVLARPGFKSYYLIYTEYAIIFVFFCLYLAAALPSEYAPLHVLIGLAAGWLFMQCCWATVRGGYNLLTPVALPPPTSNTPVDAKLADPDELKKAGLSRDRRGPVP